MLIQCVKLQIIRSLAGGHETRPSAVNGLLVSTQVNLLLHYAANIHFIMDLLIIADDTTNNSNSNSKQRHISACIHGYGQWVLAPPKKIPKFVSRPMFHFTGTTHTDTYENSVKGKGIKGTVVFRLLCSLYWAQKHTETHWHSQWGYGPHLSLMKNHILRG